MMFCIIVFQSLFFSLHSSKYNILLLSNNYFISKYKFLLLSFNTLHDKNKTIEERDNFWKQYDPWSKAYHYLVSQSKLIPSSLSDEVIQDLYSPNDQVSSFQLYQDKLNKKLYYMYMKNVCYNFKNNTILLYNSRKDIQRMLTLKEQRKQAFYWTGVNFQTINNSFPSNAFYTFDEDGIWLQSILFKDHVSHFFESISVPFTAYLEPNYFKGPVFSIEIIIVTRLIKMNPYNKETFIDFSDLYSYMNTTLYTYNDIYSKLLPKHYKSSTICFRTGVLERQNKIAMGGMFYTLLGADIYRSYLYKKHGYHYYRMNKKKYPLLLIDRRKTRKWANINEIATMIQHEFNTVIDMKLKYFEDISVHEQFISIFETDIILLSHGGGENNLLYLKPYSVIIEGNPDLFYEAFGSTFAAMTRAYFIHLNNQNTSIKIDACTKHGIEYNDHCKIKVIFTDLHISIDYIRSSLNEAIRYLNSIDFDKYRPDKDFIL